jgi:hypothetical protein
MRKSKSNAAAAELERYFDTGSYAHAANVAGTTAKATLPMEPLVFVRPSRSGGPNHRVQVDPTTLAPNSCSCQAGVHDRVCWAALDVAAGPELLNLARQRWAAARGMIELEQAAAVMGGVLRRRARAARELAERAEQDADAASYLPDPDRPIPYKITDLGRRELALEALFGPWPTVAEVHASPCAEAVALSSPPVKP